MAFYNPTRRIDPATAARAETDATTVLEKPRLESSPKLKARVDQNLMDETSLAEYRAVAKEIGLSDQDLLVEEFRIFLAGHDIPTFNLAEVVSYMDGIAAKDNPTGFGWHWCPVRPKDADVVLTFGRSSVLNEYGQKDSKSPSSDFYESHRFREWNSGAVSWSGSFVSSSREMVVNVESNVRLMQAAHDEMLRTPPRPRDWRKEPSPAYTRTLPLHALKKIALVEKNFTSGQVLFLVTDYTVAPHVIINPDPFLMAVIPNSAVAHGKGRFIIDVWDEPGFGIERMLK